MQFSVLLGLYILSRVFIVSGTPVISTLVSWLDRPQVHRTTSVVNSYLTSLNIFINGGRKHIVEKAKNDSGKVLKNPDDSDQMRYEDITLPSHASRIQALHPFPVAPYPNANEHLAGLAQTLLRKRLEPAEEKWVEDRLAKALEFAYVPPEWGIEPKKPDVKQEARDDDSDDEDEATQTATDGKPALSTTRVKGTLTEDDLVTNWNQAHLEIFDMEYQNSKYSKDIGMDDDGQDDEQMDQQGDEMQDDDEEEEEEEEEEETKAPPPVVMIQEAPPVVHQPVVGQPVMPLGFVHRFMASGEVASTS
jgi:hypothetical protein